MFTFFVFIEILVSVLLIVVVLMQASKGGGLSGSLAGGTASTVFGVRRTADFLSKATTILATIFLVLALVINIFFISGTSADSIIQGGAPSGTPSAAPPRTTPPPAQQPQQ